MVLLLQLLCVSKLFQNFKRVKCKDSSLQSWNNPAFPIHPRPGFLMTLLPDSTVSSSCFGCQCALPSYWLAHLPALFLFSPLKKERFRNAVVTRWAWTFLPPSGDPHSTCPIVLPGRCLPMSPIGRGHQKPSLDSAASCG